MKKICIFLMTCLMLPLIVYAHPGSLDENGGHYVRSGPNAGTYHYHTGEHTVSTDSYDPDYVYDPDTPYTAKELRPTPRPTPIPTPPPTPEPTKKPVLAFASLCGKFKPMTVNIMIIIGLLGLLVIIISCVATYYRNKYNSCINDLKTQKNRLREKTEILSEHIEKIKADEQRIRSMYYKAMRELKDEYDKRAKTYMKEEKENLDKDRQILDNIIEQNMVSHPELAKVLADFMIYRSERDALTLETKKHPAPKAAEVVKKYGKINSDLTEKLKKAEYELKYYKYMYKNRKKK